MRLLAGGGDFMGHNYTKDAKGQDITLEKVQELFRFLAYGETPEGMIVKYPPKVGPRKAMSIVWFLQEQMDILPDRFEMCVTCKEIYDTYTEGGYNEKTGRHHCDWCAR